MAIPDAEKQRRQKALDDHGGNVTQAAADLGMARSTLRDALRAPGDGYKVKGTSTLVDADGEVKLQWIKTREDTPSLEEVMAQVRQALDDYQPPTTLPETPATTEADLATLYPLADWHVGLLSWKQETGHNYDLKIAQTTIKTAMTRLISVAPKSKQGVILGLGDLLHSDGYANQTAKSKALLDVDGRYPKLLHAATDLLLFTIDLALQRHESVLIRVLPGNHDDESAIAVTLALSMYFKHNDRVTVDVDAGRFWYWSFGRVLLAATHGDKAKMNDLPLILASRMPEAWGKAKFRHIHTGHIHRDTMIEKLGVTVESHRTPVAPDSWHVGMGYGAMRQVSAITYHREMGEIIRQKVVIV